MKNIHCVAEISGRSVIFESCSDTMIKLECKIIKKEEEGERSSLERMFLYNTQTIPNAGIYRSSLLPRERKEITNYVLLFIITDV